MNLDIVINFLAAYPTLTIIVVLSTIISTIVYVNEYGRELVMETLGRRREFNRLGLCESSDMLWRPVTSAYGVFAGFCMCFFFMTHNKESNTVPLGRSVYYSDKFST